MYGIFEGVILNNRVEHEKSGALSEEKNKSGYDKLRELAKLRDDGIISEKDFETKKNEIMRNL